MYLEIFLFDLELHIVFGHFETIDSIVVLAQQCPDLLYSRNDHANQQHSSSDNNPRKKVEK